MPPQPPEKRNVKYAIFPFLYAGFIIAEGGNI